MNTPHHTLFYFSGELPVENYMRKHPDEFPGDGVGILLTFFSLRTSEQSRASRRLKAVLECRKYKAPKKKSKAQAEAFKAAGKSKKHKSKKVH